MRGNVDSYFEILDCYQFGRKNFNLEIFMGLLKETFNYYPERAYKTYILNVNFLVKSIYQIVKPFLPARTIEKVFFSLLKIDSFYRDQ
jgi:uncharacterized protein (DUF39 family)